MKNPDGRYTASEFAFRLKDILEANEEGTVQVVDLGPGAGNIRDLLLTTPEQAFRIQIVRVDL